jgi:HEPN domain-containing protein
MQPEALREAQDWITRAARDILMAERALSGNPALPDQAVFHAQQAAEKALKAFLAANDHPFPKTHNLERLVERCEGIDPDFTQFRSAAQILNPYATQFRYPGGQLEPSQQEADEALELADAIIEFVRERLLLV